MPDPSPRKKRKLTERQGDLLSARATVETVMSLEVARRKQIAGMHPPGAVGHVYRREIARLWRVALKAVKEAIRE